jgi:hypothetical protein
MSKLYSKAFLILLLLSTNSVITACSSNDDEYTFGFISDKKDQVFVSVDDILEDETDMYVFSIGDGIVKKSQETNEKSLFLDKKQLFELPNGFDKKGWKQAVTNEDYGFNPANGDLKKVTKGDQTVWVISGGTGTSRFKSNTKTSGKIIPSKIFYGDYFYNPLNLIMRLGGPAEGTTQVPYRAILINLEIVKGVDPGNNAFNIGFINAQSSPISKAHERISKLSDTIVRFKSGIYLDVVKDYMPLFKKAFEANGLWDKEMSLKFFYAFSDVLIQTGPRSDEKGGGARFLKYYNQFKDYKRADLLKWITDNKYPTKYKVYDLSKFDDESLVMITARLAVYHYNQGCGGDTNGYCYYRAKDGQYYGMGAVNQGSRNETIYQTVFRDVMRRWSAIEPFTSIEGTTHLITAPVAAFKN